MTRNWKKIYNSCDLVTYQNKDESPIEIGIQKIYVGMKKSEYVWRITKSVAHRMTKLLIIGEKATKKEALSFAVDYMTHNRR